MSEAHFQITLYFNLCVHAGFVFSFLSAYWFCCIDVSFFRGHNQRMEFLGDSIMQLVATEYLFIHFPDHHEGHLTVSLPSIMLWESKCGMQTEIMGAASELFWIWLIKEARATTALNKTVNFKSRALQWIGNGDLWAQCNNFCCLWNGSIILRTSVTNLGDKTSSCLMTGVSNHLFKQAHHMGFNHDF